MAEKFSEALSNEFEAEAIVLMLQDGGIPAMAQPTSDSLSRRPPEVHVRVRADDAERAAAMLLARRVESQENEGRRTRQATRQGICRSWRESVTSWR